MPRGKPKVLKYRLVELMMIWPPEKYDVISEMAKKNEVSLEDMVDEILDDWAALANNEVSEAKVPRRLDLSPVKEEIARRKEGSE